MKALNQKPFGTIKNLDANFGFNPERRLKSKGLLSSVVLPLFLFLLSLTTTGIVQPAVAQSQIEKGKSICAKAGVGSLLKQICALEGSSKKMESRFGSHLLTGGSTARLVIGREFKLEEKLEFKGLMVWDLADHKSPTVKTAELRILSVEKEAQTGNTILTFNVRRVEGKWPYLDAHFMMAAYPKDKAYPEPEAVPLYVAERSATVSSNWFAIVVSISLFVALYVLCAQCFGGDKKKWSPIAITAGSMGRGSLSKLQIFFFSFVVIWLLTYILLRTGELSALSSDVLMLLGISAAGTAGAKATAVSRKRLSSENWSWLVKKGWVKAKMDKCQESWGDLLLTEGEFDVSKFQMLAFNLVVAIALLISGLTELADFTIPPTLLGILGLSQVVYLGGKIIPANPYADLNSMTTALRDLESKFMEAVVKVWQTNPPQNRSPAEKWDLKTAKADALAEHTAYVETASKLTELVKSTLEDIATPPFNTKPDIPK